MDAEVGKKSWSGSIPRANGTASTMTASNFKPSFEVPDLKVTDSAADDADGPGFKSGDCATSACSADVPSASCFLANSDLLTLPSRMEWDLGSETCPTQSEATQGPINSVATSVLATVLDRQVQKLQRSSQNIKSMHLFPIAYLLSSFLPVIMMFLFPLCPQVRLPSQVYAFVRETFWSAFMIILMKLPGTIAGVPSHNMMLLALMFVPIVIGIGTTVALKLIKGINALNKTLIWCVFVTLVLYLMLNLGLHLVFE